VRGAREPGSGIDVERVLGYPVATVGLESCVEWIEKRMGPAPRPFVVACANPHSLVVAEDDAAFRDALMGADLLLPDGSGIVLASRLRGGRIRERVTGSDLFLGLSGRLAARTPPVRYFFLGSTPETLDAITRRMAERFPGITVAGCLSPPFRDVFSAEDEDAMVAAVNAAGPDVVWVGMTAPKQEKLIAALADRLDARVVAAVGAVFDFFSGQVTRSHPAWQRLGLEWLPRLLRQPRRLWRRTLVSAPRFLWLAARERAGRGRGREGA